MLPDRELPCVARLLSRKERTTAAFGEAGLSCLGAGNLNFNLTRQRLPIFQINKERCRKMNWLVMVAKRTLTWTS